MYEQNRESSMDGQTPAKIEGEDEKLTNLRSTSLPFCFKFEATPRVNQRVALNTRADESMMAKVDKDECWNRVWSCGSVLPNSLVDLLHTGDREEEEEEEEE